MNNVSYKKNSDKICKAALSKTLLCFYGGMLLVLIVLLVIHYLNLEWCNSMAS